MSPTGKPSAETRKPDDWSLEITITFIQVPDEKREAYQAVIKWMAMRILEEMQREQDLTAPKAEEAVSG